jgi:hypothetical protein
VNEFFAFLLGEEEESKTVTTQMMLEAVEFIMKTTENELIRFL